MSVGKYVKEIPKSTIFKYKKWWVIKGDYNRSEHCWECKEVNSNISPTFLIKGNIFIPSENFKED